MRTQQKSIHCKPKYLVSYHNRTGSQTSPIVHNRRRQKRRGFVLNLIAHNMNLKFTICIWKRLTYVSCKRHILNRFSTLNGNIKEYYSILCCCVYTLGRPYALFIFFIQIIEEALIDKWQYTAAVSQHSVRSRVFWYAPRISLTTHSPTIIF